MNYAEMDEKLKSRLKADRYIHSKGVEKLAVKLAEHYGASVEKARIAGLLHDNAKNLSPEKSLEIIGSMEIYSGVKNSPQLWHGPAGAELLKDEYGVDDPEIYDAVFYHTLGRKEMSLLTKIIYIADLLEEGRDAYLSWTAQGRELAFKDLDRAVLKVTDYTIDSLIERGMEIHPSTVEIHNEMISMIKNK